MHGELLRVLRVVVGLPVVPRQSIGNVLLIHYYLDNQQRWSENLDKSTPWAWATYGLELQWRQRTSNVFIVSIREPLFVPNIY